MTQSGLRTGKYDSPEKLLKLNSSVAVSIERKSPNLMKHQYFPLTNPPGQKKTNYHSIGLRSEECNVQTERNFGDGT
jgi:hypothetical protein